MLLLAAVAVCASVGVIASAGATAGDNMEVAGRMTHAANQAYFVACLAVVLLGPLVAIAQPFDSASYRVSNGLGSIAIRRP